MNGHKCDFLPEVVEVLGARNEKSWDRDDVILRIAQLKAYGTRFERVASLLGVDLENQPPEAVLERIQALLPVEEKSSKREKK